MLQVFDRIRKECPNAFNKIVSVHGDVSETDLGLSDEDRQRVVTEVNVVFHAAATVRFNESLKTAVTLNTLGTQRIIQLCRDMQNLQVRSCAVGRSYLGG
jgi:fatty acyl-CoA reductase